MGAYQPRQWSILLIIRHVSSSRNFIYIRDLAGWWEKGTCSATQIQNFLGIITNRGEKTPFIEQGKVLCVTQAWLSSAMPMIHIDDPPPWSLTCVRHPGGDGPGQGLRKDENPDIAGSQIFLEEPSRSFTDLFYPVLPNPWAFRTLFVPWVEVVSPLPLGTVPTNQGVDWSWWRPSDNTRSQLTLLSKHCIQPTILDGPLDRNRSNRGQRRGIAVLVGGLCNSNRGIQLGFYFRRTDLGNKHTSVPLPKSPVSLTRSTRL
jgi:hypothetical protein